MTTDFPTAPSAYGLNGPSAPVTVEKSVHASHTEILTTPAAPTPKAPSISLPLPLPLLHLLQRYKLQIPQHAWQSARHASTIMVIAIGAIIVGFPGAATLVKIGASVRDRLLAKARAEKFGFNGAMALTYRPQ